MTAQEQLQKLLDERKLLQEKLGAMDRTIRALEQKIAAESPAGWAAIWEYPGDYHVAGVAGSGVVAGLPNALHATVLPDGTCQVWWDDAYEAYSHDKVFAPNEESYGVGTEGGRFGFFLTKEDAEAAVARWKAEPAD